MTINIKDYFSPKATDKAYTYNDLFRISLICRVDSYKFGHPFAYPAGIKGMVSYGEARVGKDTTIVPFGTQMFVKRYLTQRITSADIDAAEKFTIGHFGRPLFDRPAFEKVVREYNGYLPLTIRALPEGMPVPGGVPLYTVAAFDPDLAWMSAAFETMIQRAHWYPTTIASRDRKLRVEVKKIYEETGADLNLLPFSEHDFGGRGVTCAEQAEIGGAAHLVNFMGSDTVEGILAANHFYNCEMSGFSVFATEHAIQCSFGAGEDDARRYIKTVLKNAVPGSIVSIVIDGYDVYREARLLCTEFKQDIIDSQAKVVFRPDSGNMFEIIPAILKMQEEAFGYNLTSKGYKQIKHVGIIQGDGVDHDTIIKLLTMIKELGYSADCVVFGSGGALLQKVNRDTFKYAQKACSILTDNGWVGISKDPITDPGKRSKEGVLTTVRNKNTGEITALRIDNIESIDPMFEDLMQLVYYDGELYNETTLADVRQRAE